MDKAWLWRKKSTEKLPIVAAADKVSGSSNGNEEEVCFEFTDIFVLVLCVCYQLCLLLFSELVLVEIIA